MRARFQFVITVSLALLLSLPLISDAASDLNAVINGEQLTGATCSAGNCELALTGQHAGVEFLNNVSTARVKATEGDPETLRLENVTIKALQATEHVMTFWATFSQPPKTDPSTGKKAHFDRTADGSMKRGSNGAKNDLFTISAWIDDLTDTSGEFTVAPTQYKLVTCPWTTCPASYGNFSLSTYWEATSGFTGDRVLKVEIKFDAKYVNDTLNITAIELKGVTTSGTVDGTGIGIYDSYSEEHVIQQEQEREKGKSKKGKSKKDDDN